MDYASSSRRGGEQNPTGPSTDQPEIDPSVLKLAVACLRKAASEAEPGEIISAEQVLAGVVARYNRTAPKQPTALTQDQDTLGLI